MRSNIILKMLFIVNVIVFRYAKLQVMMIKRPTSSILAVMGLKAVKMMNVVFIFNMMEMEEGTVTLKTKIQCNIYLTEALSYCNNRSISTI